MTHDRLLLPNESTSPRGKIDSIDPIANVYNFTCDFSDYEYVKRKTWPSRRLLSKLLARTNSKSTNFHSELQSHHESTKNFPASCSRFYLPKRKLCTVWVINYRAAGIDPLFMSPTYLRTNGCQGSMLSIYCFMK